MKIQQIVRGGGATLLAALFLMSSAGATLENTGGAGNQTKIMLLIGAFVVGLLMFVWIASKVMGPQKPYEDSPFFPIGVDDEDDGQSGHH